MARRKSVAKKVDWSKRRLPSAALVPALSHLLEFGETAAGHEHLLSGFQGVSQPDSAFRRAIKPLTDSGIVLRSGTNSANFRYSIAEDSKEVVRSLIDAMTNFALHEDDKKD